MYEKRPKNDSKDFQKTRHFSPQFIGICFSNALFLLKKKIKWGMEKKYHVGKNFIHPCIQYLIYISFFNSKLSQ